MPVKEALKPQNNPYRSKNHSNELNNKNQELFLLENVFMWMKKSLIDNKTILNLWPNRYIIKIIESGKYKLCGLKVTMLNMKPTNTAVWVPMTIHRTVLNINRLNGKIIDL